MVLSPNISDYPEALIKLLWLTVFVFFITIWLLLQTDIHRTSVQFFEPEFFIAETAESSQSSNFYLVKTEGCRIPFMDPFDPSIRQYIISNNIRKGDEEGPIRCAPPGPKLFTLPLVSSNISHIFIVKSALEERNLTVAPDCCYEPFWRKKFNVSLTEAKEIRDADSQFVTTGKCFFFEESADMGQNEFVKVKCYQVGNRSEIIYKDFFAFTPTRRRKTNILRNEQDKKPWSVLILGVDSVSRLNLYRQMPKTLAYVKNQLKGIEMFGYNKVADNTFPNLVPLLTGLSVDELKNNCWPTEQSYFDNCPLLWKNFSEFGYKTLFAEDASWMGIFSYMKKGFFNQPTDHYWRVFNTRAEKEIGSEKRLNAHLCTGYRTTLQTLLEYGKKFVLTYMNEPFFGLIWGASLSHDYLNLPRYGDDDHKDFLKSLVDKGALNNSIIIFTSDHGIRWGGIRSTYQGHLEERLPFLYFIFPEQFRKKYTTAIGNLYMNSHHLTTPYDVYETLNDILHSNKRLDTKILNKRILSGSFSMKNNITDWKKRRKGLSLFLPIPKYRTCELAGIPDHWCTCHRATVVSVNDTDVVKAAIHLIEHINRLLVGESKRCVLLHPKKILSARMEQTLPNVEDSTNEIWVKDYIITVEAHPSGAIFEATVRRNPDGSFKTMGTVSRTNVYGNQSACISNYKLKLYCYCIDYQ